MSELITGVTPVSSLPSMTTEEYQANATVLVVDGNDGRLKRIARTSLYESIQALVKGDKGATGATGAQGVKGAQGDKGDKGDTGANGATGSQGVTGLQGVDGSNGWSPIYALEARSNDLVIKVVDWVGGSNAKPTANVYIGTTGFVTDINQALNIKGVKGDKGDVGAVGSQGLRGWSGWSPLIKVSTVSGLRYLELYDWTTEEVILANPKPTTLGYLSSAGITPTPQVGSDIGADYSAQIADIDSRISNVDNISDLNKPISTATQTALDGKVDKSASPITFMSAAGVPEGSAVASIPTLYVDSITGNVYSKTTPTGNTGWKLVSLV